MILTCCCHLDSAAVHKKAEGHIICVRKLVRADVKNVFIQLFPLPQRRSKFIRHIDRNEMRRRGCKKQGRSKDRGIGSDGERPGVCSRMDKFTVRIVNETRQILPHNLLRPETVI